MGRGLGRGRGLELHRYLHEDVVLSVDRETRLAFVSGTHEDRMSYCAKKCETADNRPHNRVGEYKYLKVMGCFKEYRLSRTGQNECLEPCHCHVIHKQGYN